MPRNKPQTWQIENLLGLKNLGQAARTLLEVILTQIDTEQDSPLRLAATFPTADSNLNIRSSFITKSDKAAGAMLPINGVTPTFVDSAVDFQAQTTSGGVVSIAFPPSTVGQYRRCAFSLDSTNTLFAVFSAEVVSIGSLADPATLYGPGQPTGWIDLECTDISGKFKTAGSLTNIIENSVGGVARIVRLSSGGATPASGLVYKQEPLQGVVDGVNNVFTTTALPHDVNELSIFINGSLQYLTSEWTYAVVGGVGQITFVTPPSLSDLPYSKYLETNSQPGFQYKQEDLIGIVDGVNAVFTTSLLPWDVNEISVFIDGALQYFTSEWTYAVVGGVGQITFVTPPSLSDLPYIRYLVKN